MNFSGHNPSKLMEVGVSVFARIGALATQHNAVNLSQGFPDFPSYEKMINLVHENMLKGHNQYLPMSGLFSLREVISDKIKSQSKIYYNPETEITITAGATQAIYTAITSVIEENDEVIVFEPAYDSYIPAIKLNGGIPIYIELNYPDYTIDWDYIKKRVNNRTKMIIINTPNNPTGKIMSYEDFKELEKIVSNSNILILSDEVYEHIIFDNKKHYSICDFPELASRSFVIYSFGKMFHTTGWKLGYCLAPEILTTQFRKIHQFIVFTCNTPIQNALSEFMKEKTYLEIGKMFQEKRNYFLDNIKQSKFKFIPTEGTYFQILDYSAISLENDEEYAKQLIIESGLATIPISSFYHTPNNNTLLRVCFAKTDNTLDKAIEIICKI